MRLRNLVLRQLPFCLLAAMPCLGSAESNGPTGFATYIAPYISEPARNVIRNYVPRDPGWPQPDDVAGWTALQHAVVQQSARALQRHADTVSKFERRAAGIPGVDAYWFTSSKMRVDGPVLVYTHGGGYAIGSGREVPPAALAVAEAAGMRLLSIDYRLAPQHPFPAGLDDVVVAYRWLLDQRVSAKSIGWFGDSAGGGLALASMHAFKQRGLPLPGCVAVLSPWTDLTLVSESYVTLDAADPAFTIGDIRTLARTYHQQSSPANPLVSPVLGDFSGFPPMLIQAGSKEILLSDSLRLARAARSANVDVDLDVWDGMWHVFQLMDVPESREAIDELGEFFRRNLPK